MESDEQKLEANSNNVLSNLKVIQLSPTNYSNWRVVVKNLLTAKNLWKYCETSIPDSASKNAEAKAIIYASMEPGQLTATGTCETAHELWLKIKENHEGGEKVSHAVALSNLLGIKFRPSETLLEFMGRYEVALGRAQSYYDKDKDLDEDTKIWAFKNTLPKDYKKTVNIWRAGNLNGKISELITYMKTDYHDDKNEEADAVALFSLDKSKSKANLTCNHCKKPGHGWRECRKRKADMKRRKKFGEEKKKNDEQAKVALFNFSFLSLVAIPHVKRYTWIVDSGATAHMTPHKDYLTDFQAYDKPTRAFMGDGDPLPIIGAGNYRFYVNGMVGALGQVKLVPQLKQNLLSISKLTELGLICSFEGDHFYVRRPDGKEIIKSHRRGEDGLFLVDLTPPMMDIRSLQTCDESANTAIDIWHQRFAHCGIQALQNLARSNAVAGLDLDKGEKLECVDCICGKICRAHHRPRTTVKASEEAAVVHFDTVGPITPESLGGNKYFVLATEEYSGYRNIFFCQHKSQITDNVKKIINLIELDSRRSVKMVCSDNGTEFVNRSLREWLDNKGINLSLSAVETPQQNGLAERSNRTIIECTRTLLLASKLNKKLWAEAASTAVYTLNRTLSPRDKTKTRYELYFGKQPDVSNLAIFGQHAAVKRSKQKRKSKWDAIGDIYRFVGYTERVNTFRLYDEDDERVFTSCDVRFINDLTTTKQSLPKDNYVSFDLEISDDDTQENDQTRTTIDYYDEQAQPVSSPEADRTQYFEADQQSSDTGGISSIESMPPLDSIYEQLDYEQLQAEQQAQHNEQLIQIDEVFEQAGPSNQQPNINDQIHAELGNRFGNQGVRTRSQNGIFKPIFPDKNFPGVDPNTLDLGDFAHLALEDEPITVADAEQSSEWVNWKEAIDEELNSLNKNGVFKLVDQPAGAKPISSKWVFKKKYDDNGNVARYKARLVAKGFSQIEGIDYKETYAPVAAMNTIRILFASAAQFKMDLLQFDVKTAFLHGELDETIYMHVPEGYEGENDGKVCKLERSIYGLKQAPRQWNKKFDEFLKNFNLKNSNIDKCFYHNDDKSIMLVIYVDDGLVAVKRRKDYNSLIEYLRKKLELTSGKCTNYVGFQVENKRKDGCIKLHQRNYIERLLQRNDMTDCKPISTPEEVGAIDFSESEPLGKDNKFKSMIGGLQYLVSCTRPDIAHAVNIASRTSKPTEAHIVYLKRILRYLRGTMDMGICFRWEKQPELTCFSDADYANCKITRRSTTGYCIMLGGGPIAWRCKQQDIISLSTTEAEYIAATEVARDLIPIKALVSEIGLVNSATPTQLYIDNLSTVNIAKDSGRQQRTKHIDVRHKWLAEQHQQGAIVVKHIPGNMQVADILTKPLHKAKFAANRLLLMLSVLMIMFAIVLNGNAYSLRSTSPIYYTSSGIEAINGTKELELNITIINPCIKLFENITLDNVINERLTKDCNNRFKQSTSDVLKPESCKVRPRYPRNPLILIPAVVTVVVAGATVYNTAQSYVNAQNIKKLAKSGNDEKELFRLAYASLNSTRNSIVLLNSRIDELEKRVDWLNRTVENFPQIISLVDYNDNNFNNYKKHLYNINANLPDGKVAAEILELANLKLWEYPMHKWTELLSCSVIRADMNFSFVIKFRFPVKAENVKIQRGAGLRFWNQTKPNEYCWMKYAGPRYVLVNHDNNCYMEIAEYSIIDETYRGNMCDVENKKLQHKHSLYHPDYCVSDIDETDDYQMVTRNGYNKIYCYGLNITVGSKETACPDHVFELPTTQDYAIGSYHHIAERSTVKIELNPIDITIERDIVQQLNADKLNIVANITEEMDKANTLLNRMINKLGANISLTEMPSLPDALQQGVDSAIGSVRSVWDWIRTILTYAFGFSALFMLCALAPVIELLIFALRHIFSSFGRVSSTFKSACSSVSRRIPRRAAKTLRSRSNKFFY